MCRLKGDVGDVRSAVSLRMYAVGICVVLGGQKVLSLSRMRALMFGSCCWFFLSRFASGVGVVFGVGLFKEGGEGVEVDEETR